MELTKNSGISSFPILIEKWDLFCWNKKITQLLSIFYHIFEKRWNVSQRKIAHLRPFQKQTNVKKKWSFIILFLLIFVISKMFIDSSFLVCRSPAAMLFPLHILPPSRPFYFAFPSFYISFSYKSVHLFRGIKLSPCSFG